MKAAAVRGGMKGSIARRIGGLAGVACAAATPVAQAHVKRFAPCIVGACPQPLSATLTNQWFWTGIALARVIFLVARAAEQMHSGQGLFRALDRIMAPLWLRLGIHLVPYGADGTLPGSLPGSRIAERATHTYSVEYPHGPGTRDGSVKCER